MLWSRRATAGVLSFVFAATASLPETSTLIRFPTPDTTQVASAWSCDPSLGAYWPLRIDNNGDVQCWSSDGQVCTWGIQCTRLDVLATGVPISCGSTLEIASGTSGYNTPGHWCTVGQGVLQRNPRLKSSYLATSNGMPTPPTSAPNILGLGLPPVPTMRRNLGLIPPLPTAPSLESLTPLSTSSSLGLLTPVPAIPIVEPLSPLPTTPVNLGLDLSPLPSIPNLGLLSPLPTISNLGHGIPSQSTTPNLGLGIPPLSTIPSLGLDLPPIPTIPNLGLALPPLPTISSIGLDIPPLPTIPSLGLDIPPLPTIPSLGLDIPPLPAIPSLGLDLRPLTAIPNLGLGLLTLPTIPNLGLGLLPLPTIPNLGLLPTLPTIPNFGLLAPLPTAPNLRTQTHLPPEAQQLSTHTPTPVWTPFTTPPFFSHTPTPQPPPKSTTESTSPPSPASIPQVVPPVVTQESSNTSIDLVNDETLDLSNNHTDKPSNGSHFKTNNKGFNGNTLKSGNNDRSLNASTASTQGIVLVQGEDMPVAQTGRVVLNGAVASTMAALMVFHVTAITLPVASTSATGIGPPNLWELPTFMTFLQNMAVVAMASIDAPYQPFVLFTDMFSWLLFQVKGSEPSPPVMNGSPDGNTAIGVTFRLESNATTTNATSIYDAFGIEQFALRLHIRKQDMFIRAWAAFFIATGGILVLLLFCHSASYLLFCVKSPFTSDDGWLPWFAGHLTATGQKLQGFLMWVATQAMMPLTAVTVYAATQESKSNRGFGHSATGIIALSLLLILGSACIGTSLVLAKQNRGSLEKFQTKLTFGVLYVNLKFHLRAFSGVSLLVQFATGVFMSGFIQPGSQMIWLIVIHALYVLVLLGVRPFVTKLHLIVAVLVEVVNIVIYGLSFAQAKASHDDLDTKKRLGWAIMGLVGVLIVLFFARTLVKVYYKVTGGINKFAPIESSRGMSSMHRSPSITSDNAGTLLTMPCPESNGGSFRSMSPVETARDFEAQLQVMVK
ncbi:Aste57867_24310 [Aphanomyces stellatus]|uniref:Aste57867_24310 protein n=1 Tax=Aphanomyces stellatus TaxID=120398 RepID=A0A485LQU1_9STRA|nr:hypothetical protein As57867_024235 [Aphanomyces stellatus]VFU00950.1 Aste57867_24310 [Aphanomyces stellatus]